MLKVKVFSQKLKFLDWFLRLEGESGINLVRLIICTMIYSVFGFRMLDEFRCLNAGKKINPT